jgi:APA family basic amino acid/polyamine antiporter
MAVNAAPQPAQPTLARSLGLFSAANLVMGSMIGSGIFIVSADIARTVGGAWWVLASWVVAAVMTVMGAASYGELAAMYPHAGGQYVYLREAWGRLPAFLFGWTSFVVIQAGSIAAVGVAFAKFAGVLFPWISGQHVLLTLGPVAFSSEQAVALVTIAFLTGTNCLGVKAGSLVQNVFTVLKVATLLGVTAVGLFAFGAEGAALTAPDAGLAVRDGVPVTGLGIAVAIGVSLVGSLFAADAWNNVTFASGEVREPGRDVPRALVLGAAVVCGLYLLTNLAYLAAMPQDLVAHAPDDRVAAALMTLVVGPRGAALMAALVMVSTFGCLNGMILAGPRVTYAMANDGLFPAIGGRLGERSRVPTGGLVLQGLWAGCLTLSGSYGDLLDYVIVAVLLFYSLTVLGVFRLRRTRPDAPRPFRAPLYPVLPALYILACVAVVGVLLVEKPRYTWPGIGLVALGVPVYFVMLRAMRRKG